MRCLEIPMHKKQTEYRVMYGLLLVLFLVFLCMPAVLLLYQAIQGEEGLTLSNLTTVLSSSMFWTALKNSFVVSGCAALCTALLSFLLAYAIHFTNINQRVKNIIRTVTTLPMLLPTITYGFALVYTFGKQGVLSKILGFQLFDIYGFQGLLIGYVIYTLPIGFLLVNNTMKYIDKKFIIVSKIMQDSNAKRFYMTVLLPLIPTLGAAFLQSFFLSFTDFGIPAAVGGEYDVVATTLYNTMLGAIPDFQQGAVIAMMMLIPSVLSVIVLRYLDRFQIKYHKTSMVELPKSPVKDRFITIGCGVILIGILFIFGVIFILPFIKEWPYEVGFSLDHIVSTLTSSNLIKVYRNSLVVALASAIIGCVVAYSAALLTTRSRVSKFAKNSIDQMSSIANTIPGMVLGIAFLFAFKSTSLQNTFTIMILCNVIHFFSTPYVMAKNTLGKMNASYETTAKLMGDGWLATIRRVVIPNSKSTILEMFSYYFTNSMVTISALIFLVGAKTAVLTTKIKELQHFAKFDDIFVLSILILLTNLLVKGLIALWAKPSLTKQKQKMKKAIIVMTTLAVLLPSFILGSGKDPIVIYSNADEEALTAMRHALDEHGFSGQYLLQSFGTSELGGKLMAEGADIEADIVTMSSYYLDSAQEQHDLFANLNFTINPIEKTPSYREPFTALEGTLIINTLVMEEKQLPIPTSIKDLCNPIYKGYLSIPDINASSTGWLLIQAIIDCYGEESDTILQQLLANVGPHVESSGSGPIKKVRSGEVAIAFGLRHQAVADQSKGLPIAIVDPIEGNMRLGESLAVLDKENKPLAMEMAKCIKENAREELLATYPVALYQDEQVALQKQSLYPATFSEPLTVDLLKQHQAFFQDCLS